LTYCCVSRGGSSLYFDAHMNVMFRLSLALLFSPLAIAPSAALPIIDGTRDAEYGTALSVQTVRTGFGDNANELDAAYGFIGGGKLYLMIAGNMEDNFNKLEIFIDSRPGGQNVFDSSGNDSAGNMDGLVFDPGFLADYHVITRRGHDTGNDKFDLDFANLSAQSASGYFDFFASSGHVGSGITGTGVNTVPIDVGYDHSNTAGVGAGSNEAWAASPAEIDAAAAVTTGLELSISLSDLSWTGGPIKIMVGQNNQSHDFWSNQFLGPLTTPIGNLNYPGSQDFSLIPGEQFFKVSFRGDFNFDGRVDAADYVVLRDNGGTAADYATWRTNFGSGPPPAGSEVSIGNTVPEPSVAALLALSAIGVVTSLMTSPRSWRT
jgi:hypothetical protein